MKRKGFTQIELLTVLAVVFLGVSLTLPAIQRVRGQANAIECKDRLHNIGIAVHNYAEVYSELLPPAVVDGSPVLGSGTKLSWGSLLLPFLERRNIYDQLKQSFDKDGDRSGKHKAFTRSMKIYRCPGDGVSNMNSARGGWATSNYVAVSGADVRGSVVPGRIGRGTLLQTPPTTWHRGRLDLRGVMGYSGSGSLANITNADGTPYTAIVGERCSLDGAAVWTAVSDPGVTDDVVGDCAPGSEINRHLGTGFSSRHKGGANFLFADASVRFISEEIESKLTFDKEGASSIGIYQMLGAFQDSRAFEFPE